MSTSQEKKLPSNRTYTVDDIAAIIAVVKMISSEFDLRNLSQQFVKMFASASQCCGKINVI